MLHQYCVSNNKASLESDDADGTTSFVSNAFNLFHEFVKGVDVAE